MIYRDFSLLKIILSKYNQYIFAQYNSRHKLSDSQVLSNFMATFIALETISI